MKQQEQIDWSVPELIRSAVEYAIDQAGEPRVGRRGESGEWESALVPVAAALGLDGREGRPGLAELAAWCRAPEYAPPGAYLGDIEGMDDADRDTAITVAAGRETMAEGGVPNAVADPLTALLAGESDAISEGERAELLRVLGSGEPLTRHQRIVLGVILRGSDGASRRDIVRGLIDFLVPEGVDNATVWERRETMVTLPLGGGWEVRGASISLPRYAAMGRQHLLIKDAHGEPWRVMMYSRVRAIRGERLCVWSLAPVRRFCTDTVAINLALLKTWVTNSGRQQKEWAAVFGVKKQNINHHARKLAEKLGGGIRGMRNKPQANKGKPKAS